jgi:hypothetical protein
MMATPFMTRSCLNLAKRSSRLRVFSSNSNSSVSNILCQLQEGKINVKQAETLLSGANNKDPEETLQPFANLDHGRAMRAGFPEAIFAQGKTSKQVALILDDMALAVNKAIQNGQSDSASTAILATRVTPEQFQELQKYPLKNGTLTYHETARIVSMKASGLDNIATSDGAPTTERSRVVVACAGTTDLPVAEEAAVTLEAAGCNIDRIYDVGVAGLHRIVKAIPRLRDPSVGCVIVCAGMDGALPSVVGGLVSVPVIAAPTSIGYGASFGGVSAMLTMLNSCAPGVGVVNIDNGFGAAALAYKCIKK